jgi:hypothetical protein
VGFSRHVLFRFVLKGVFGHVDTIVECRINSIDPGEYITRPILSLVFGFRVLLYLDGPRADSASLMQPSIDRETRSTPSSCFRGLLSCSISRLTPSICCGPTSFLQDREGSRCGTSRFDHAHVTKVSRIFEREVGENVGHDALAGIFNYLSSLRMALLENHTYKCHCIFAIEK